MDPLLLATIGLPLTIVILVIIGFYKLFIKKKSITSFYTPFDNITGQTISEFHEEQKVLVSEDEDGDGKVIFSFLLENVYSMSMLLQN
ncbi:DUF3951 domain-containing protein [Bacillus anthracis]|uniref:DUF3951 domain-containing protein n=1 Tax=Bacillus anthracis TaxID=1392 RepID=UPI000627C5A2|nr:DUF3951 domain-containing protein [Bacillus anthracis]KKM30591.1 hypothetical protein KD34_22610 [Bacillus anthracis]KKM34631.1 hypothetical protein JF23_10490 [Bacillus anthracis]KON19872.1 hypothetical protein AB171_02690 [Bacillus anthracis]MBJ7917454.1 DUF3951 domain-containing protein [Bacillus anthracis]PTR82173.1 DUF3951 domain-containing protein [Bacillus anthracis]